MNAGFWLAGVCCFAAGVSARAGEGAPAAKGAYAFEVESIDGKPIKLSAYSGKVCLIVNVASK